VPHLKDDEQTLTWIAVGSRPGSYRSPFSLFGETRNGAVMPLGYSGSPNFRRVRPFEDAKAPMFLSPEIRKGTNSTASVPVSPGFNLSRSKEGSAQPPARSLGVKCYGVRVGHHSRFEPVLDGVMDVKWRCRT